AWASGRSLRWTATPLFIRPASLDGHRPAPQPQPGHAAIRENAEPHVRHRTARSGRDGKAVAPVRPQPCPRHELAPRRVVRHRETLGALKAAALRIVALEMRRVHLRGLDHAPLPEFKHHPVESPTAPPPSHPSVAP